MPETMRKATPNEPVTPEGSKDTISQLFDDRDRANQESGIKHQESGEQPNNHAVAESPTSPKPQPEQETAKGETAKPPQDKGNLDEDADESSQASLPKKSLPQPEMYEADALRAKLEKTEKVLAENQRYGRNNAQKLKNALKAVRKFADDGVLAQEEAEALFGVLQSAVPENSEGEEEYALKQSNLSQASPFAPIFEIANKELQNIFKYTDDEFLPDKVKAFDYFLSVGSKEEIANVLEDLTALRDEPVKLARKMLSIGARVYEESYKGISQAGGFKEYLAGKEESIEKMQKKIDKLEKKLLQYEDFDKPRYRIDETGSPGMDDEGNASPAQDTISALLAERDKVRRKG
jgi:hypothetical protein